MLTSQYAPSKQAGNGITTAFSGSWKIIQASDLAVYKIDASGNQGALLILGTDYTVSFDTVQETWTVTYTVAPVSGGYSLVERVSNNTQETSLPREGSMPAQSVETMVDKNTALIQELQAMYASIITTIVTPAMESGSYSQMNTIALANPTQPFVAFITDYQMLGVYSGNVNIGQSGWFFK
jgi:hypothetical protein